MSLNRIVVLSAVIVTTDLQQAPTEQQDLTARLRGFTQGSVEFAQECANVLDPQTALGLSYTNNTKNPPTNFNDGRTRSDTTRLRGRGGL